MRPLDVAYRLLPGIKWLHGYTAQDAIADLIAGITVGLTVLPQGLAYATLAGLEPQYGLYSAFIGGIVYAFLGSCRQVTIGPTALLALMTSRHTSFGLNSGPAYAILLCLISGIVEFLMAVLRLGALVDLISLPVTVGFTSATAVIIGTSQLKGLLGIRGGGGGSGFLKTMQSVFTNLDNIRYGDFTLGIIAITILLLLRKLKDVKIPGRRVLSGTLWVIATGRNALIVLIASILAYNTCETRESCPFVLTGKVKSGFPDVEVPKFHTTIQLPNGTAIEQDYVDMLKELGPSMLILPIIAVLGNVAISKAFSSAGISPTRELIALSLSNVVGSFFSSMPVTGSFSRSAVNHASGVRTPIGGFYTSALVLLALGLLAPYFQYIPKAALSAVIISAVIFMIEFEVVKPLWRCSRRELLPGAITFVVSLAIGVEIGLLLGVGVDVAYLVYRAARPALSVSKLRTTNGTEYILMRPIHSSLYFPAIEWVRTGISKAVAMHGSAPVVLDCANMHELDFTVARGMGALHKELASNSVPLFLMKASKEISVILKESTNCEFPTIESPDDLEYILDNTASIDDHRLQVTIPLISARTKLNGGDSTTIDGGGGGGCL
ncbi:sodium-independent sulfate anion transporter isoform X1 [Anastrepha obliqua]|uniref:sodium-independent sulfate anion transporter isoform X1 n=1 Tax=Anastrepha obliqua TaxID=95512 RepID=UPI00240A21B7|nr:sodium-independent sulfate anion transporter isoform X1 [Anastrepha obliqua]XP_054736001.1 sodium-independent sulfate anion transporter isoform X1 [Anastrepha obliqua]XP_054736002.1 sodium-independent sulfate anion transporter isoform X1 [Anastrepha obliqua]XP_054736003.1 sodium-independent sulfate anion transporter isoform X1 [Anastrepha obliqua]XP_054736004.1 sodium-independent sulfate anion transporter isoform X1 [Anastrepha obliqua]XP_054736005.1 sodium-independent sulfate anion transpo